MISGMLSSGPQNNSRPMRVLIRIPDERSEYVLKVGKSKEFR